MEYRAKNIIVCDRRGAIYRGRKNGMNKAKEELAELTNKGKNKGSLKEILAGADVFIGVSAPNILQAGDIQKMNKGAIVFAMANPIPEIFPLDAHKGGAKVVATGRSDFPNQINNALVFPGIFRGALDTRTRFITDKIAIKVAEAIAGLVKKPKADKIILEVLDKNVTKAVAKIF